MMDIELNKRKILSTLRETHSNKWVSPLMAVRNCDPCTGEFRALNELIKDAIIERKSFNDGLYLVRYTPTTPHLRVV